MDELRAVKKVMATHDTKYSLFLIVLGKSYETISHWLGLNDSFAITTNFCFKRSEIGHISYYRGTTTFFAPCAVW